MREMKHEYNIFLPVVILNEQKCKRENIHIHTMCFALYILFSYGNGPSFLSVGLFRRQLEI